MIWLVLIAPAVMAQTSWKGTSSTSWTSAANWTAGVPTASVDVIIGDANFTGPNQPSLTASGTSGACRSLTLGTGTKACTLTVSRSLVVSGNITIGANGRISHTSTSSSRVISLLGNWTNSGTYAGSSSSSTVAFDGNTQSIGGGTATGFRRLSISAGSATTLGNNISVTNTLTVNGTLNPGAGSGVIVSGAGAVTVANGGKILVRGSTFAGNYALSGTKTLSAGSTVDYAANGDQTVDNTRTYSTLRISGSGVKTLAGNLPALVSSVATAGIIEVAAGTLDLSSFTANRGTSVAGGTVSVAAGATLKIGGTGTFPANYATHSLASASTVEYGGGNQTVTAESYGHLSLSGSSGTVTKTMPASALTVAGNLIASQGSATSLAFTPGGSLTVNGNIFVGTGVTFNGSTFSHSIGGHWTNNGTFAGGTSTITMNGVNGILAGTGVNNFNKLTIAGSGIKADANTSLNLSGNFATTGAGTFTHSSGGTGTVTMSGTSTITGGGISFSKLTLLGTITTPASFTITDNLTVNGSLTASAGTITLSGAGKTLTGSGTMAFSGLNVPGSITTAKDLSLSGNLSVAGSFSATAGMVTFKGSTVFTGTANLFNATLNGTVLQLGADSVLRLAGTTTLTAGTFDVTSQRPNTVVYNSASSQTVYPTTYDNLEIAAGGTKTAGGNITVKNDLVIDPSADFNGGSGTYTINVRHHWLNSGTFSAGDSTVEMVGPGDSTIAGATTFHQLRVNKDASSLLVRLSTNSAAVATLDMAKGTLDTGTNTLTITSTRTGNDHVLGTITRQHSFAVDTAYAFEGPFTTIRFTALPTSLTAVTMKTTLGAVGDFPDGAAINRQFTLSLASSGAYAATFRAYYQDAELNGNAEGSALLLWRNSGSGWASPGGTTDYSTTDNWVEEGSLTDLSGRWTLSSFDSGIVQWNGSTSTNWEAEANWTVVPGGMHRVPTDTDIVELGSVVATYQPTISSSVTVKSLSFGSAQATTLALGSGGSLQTVGNVAGSWTANATHTINVGTRTLSVGGDLVLSDGTAGHAINLILDSGTVSVSQNLVQSGGANITFTGAGTLDIGGSFLYSGGTFTAGAGTVRYIGSGAQTVGGVTYQQLAFAKTAGIATLPSGAAVNSNLLLGTGGSLRLDAELVVAGSVTIGTGTILDLGGMGIYVGGDWTCNGTLNISSGGQVTLNGNGAQSVGPCTFHDLRVEKSVGSTAALAGSISVLAGATVASGTLDLSNHTMNESSSGSMLTLASGARLRTTGSFPTGFAGTTIDPGSTVEYYGAGDQSIAEKTYGHLMVINGGGSHPKTLAGSITVAGDLSIDSTAALTASSYSLTLLGNWTNSGAFTPGTGTVVLGGTNKTVVGNTTFNNLTVTGTNTVANCDITIQGNATILGGYYAGTGTHTIYGDLHNSGMMRSDGTTTFMGTRLQTIQLLTPIQSVSSGIVNFNGTVSPVLNSTASPQFANVNINNSGGVTASVGWTVGAQFSVGSGAAFHGSAFAHTFYGSVNNSGSMTSGGTLDFHPLNDTTLVLGNSFSSSGMVVFNGTKQITISSGPLGLGSVQVANTHAAGITPVSNWTLAGDLQIAGGAIFHAGAGLKHTIAGNVHIDGALDGGSSLVVFNGASEVTGSGSTVFNSVLVGSSLVTFANITLTGNFTNNGSFESSGADLIFAGGGTATIAGNTTPTTINSLTIAKSSAAVTLAVNVDGLTSLTISGGTLDTGIYSLSQNAAEGGALTVSAGGILKLGGGNQFPSFNGINLHSGSTVNYSGTAQTVGALTYANLILSGSHNKTLAATATVNGNLEINGTAKFNLTYASGSYSPVGSLSFGGTLQAAGTWGSTSSAADHQTDTYFQGAGKLNVGNRSLDHFAVTTPGTQTAGTPFSIITITAQDANNNTVDTFTGTVDMTETGDGADGTVTPSQSGAFTAGVLSGQIVTLSKAGAAVTITVADHAGTGKSGVGDAFTVNPGAMHHYAVTFSPPPFHAGVPFDTVVTAQDASGNTITSDSSTWVTVSSSSPNMTWDATDSGEFENGTTTGEEYHITKPLTNGVTAFKTRDNMAEAGKTITASSTGPTITGTSEPIDIQTLAGAYRSKVSGSWGNASTWETFNGSEWVVATSSPSSTDGVVTIRSPHAVTVGADFTVDQVYVLTGGQLSVSSGFTLTVPSGASPGLEVNGRLHNAGTLTFGSTSHSFIWPGGELENLGTINSSFATLEFEPGSPGGKYRHLFTTTAGTIPTAEWENGSICEVAGYTSNTTPPSGLNQSFHDLTWNCPSQIGTIVLDGNPTTIGGNFTVTATGSGALTLGGNLAVTGPVTVGSEARLHCGTFAITGPLFTLASGGTLGIGSPSGISSSGTSGNIQTTTRTFPSDGDYTYNGVAAQVTGNGLPATVNNLTINNSAGVTLGTAETVGGTMALGSSGLLKIGTIAQNVTAYALTIGGAAQPPGTWGSTGSSATYRDDIRFDSTGSGLVTVNTGSGGYRITATTTTPSAGVADPLTITLVDAGGTTITSFSGGKTLTFSGLATAGDGTAPTVTDKDGLPVNLGTSVAITFANGVSSAAGGSAVLKAYKAENATLNVSDSVGLSSTISGPGVSLSIANVTPATTSDSLTRARNVPLRIRISDLLSNDTDANHDALSLSSVVSPSAQGATLAHNSAYILYTPGENGNVSDSFTYRISDGITIAEGTVNITMQPDPGTQWANIVSYGLEDGHPAMTFAGIPTVTYDVQRAQTLTGPWTTVHTTNTPSAGLFKFVDMSETTTDKFYRTTTP